MKRLSLMVSIAVFATVSSAAFASQTVTYIYDAKGRLVKVVRTGNVSNGVTTEITHDKADNRTGVKVSGAP